MTDISRRYSDKKPAPPSEITSDWVAQQIKDFLAKGGKVQLIPEGVTAANPEEQDE